MLRRDAFRSQRVLERLELARRARELAAEGNERMAWVMRCAAAHAEMQAFREAGLVQRGSA